MLATLRSQFYAVKLKSGNASDQTSVSMLHFRNSNVIGDSDGIETCSLLIIFLTLGKKTAVDA